MAVTKQDQYLGNPNLKKGHTKSRFTKKQVEEVIKCLDDPKYFIRKYLKIVTIDKGLVPFDMYKFQEKMVDTFHENRFYDLQTAKTEWKINNHSFIPLTLCVIQ